MDPHNRVVVLIDMDCFYCQVEEKLNPELKGKPIAVVQYNPWKGGGIIAVNYVARDRGVTRHMRGDEAKEKCPDIQLPSVPCQRGKADISKYREAGKEVARVLQKFTDLLERASIDEAYLDITAPVEKRLKSLNLTSITTSQMPNTYALGYDEVTGLIRDVQNYGSECIEFDYEHASRLLVGAIIVSEIRAAVYEETGYRCSAGIAPNKILAKLVCGMNKPNKQTVLPKHCVNVLYSTLSLKKVKHLGGKFGDSVCSTLKISKMAELQGFTEKELQNKFDEKNGTWLYNIARGIDLEPVQARFNPKSIGCCKQFKGKAALLDLHSLRKWLKDLGDEIEDRLEKDALESNRTPKQMVVSFSSQLPDGRDTSSSRSYNFTADEDLCGELFSGKALDLVMDSLGGDGKKDMETNRKLPMPIKFLGISVGKFEDHADTKKNRKIMDFFGAGSSKSNTTTIKEQIKQNDDENKKETVKVKIKPDKEYILEKFLQGATKTTVNVNKGDETTKPTNEIKTDQNTKSSNDIRVKPTDTIVSATTTLEKQESFFAKFLNQENNKLKQKIKETDVRPTTPICKVVECGDNSNDSDYSTSTINAEINKSISLFEDNPADVARVTEIRNLLTSHRNEDLIEPELSNIEAEPSTSKTPISHIETYECEECKKQIPIVLIQTHADYHLALKLREEERQIFKKEKDSRTKTLQVLAAEQKLSLEIKPKPELNTSIANFLVKVDNNTPLEICSHCKKRVPVAKLPEHLDFHEAQRLSRELNKKQPLNYSINSVKRKRKSISPEKKSKVPCKPISSFFVNR